MFLTEREYLFDMLTNFSNYHTTFQIKPCGKALFVLW